MQSRIELADNQQMFKVVNEFLSKGWILNPGINGGKPLRLENAVVYHLLLIENDADLNIVMETLGSEGKVAERKIIDVISVSLSDHGQVAACVKEGYEVQSVYAKNVVAVKYEVEKDTVKSDPGAENSDKDNIRIE